MTRLEQDQANCDKAATILELTEDGRLLFQTEQEIERHGRNGDGKWLKLVECAVNGLLTEAGQKLFDALHRQVLAGDYSYPIGEFESRFVAAK